MFIAPVTTVVAGAGRRGRAGLVWFQTLVPPAIVPNTFSQLLITAVYPPQFRNGFAYLSWLSVAPAGTWFQVYVNEQLVYAGQTPSCVVAVPAPGSRVDIGTVPTGQQNHNYESSLPAAPQRFASLSWLGGTYEDPDIAGFHVYGEPRASAGINYTTPIATITAYPQSMLTDGYGFGGYGDGGYGLAASTYTWTSGSLSNGDWHFAVLPFDVAGNEGPASLTSVFIGVPPLEPGLCFGDGTRMHYTYDFPSKEITLRWCASPG